MLLQGYDSCELYCPTYQPKPELELLAMSLLLPLLIARPMSVLPIKNGSLNYFPETLFKDRYLVSGSGIAKLFQDPAL